MKTAKWVLAVIAGCAALTLFQTGFSGLWFMLPLLFIIALVIWPLVAIVRHEENVGAFFDREAEAASNRKKAEERGS